MMMSRPKEEAPAAAKPVVQVAPKTTNDAVEDLERRIQMLGDVKLEETKKEPEETKQPEEPPLLPPPVEEKPSAPVKGGKNALLARIMAAQEKAKMAANKQEEQPDLLAPPKDEPLPPPAFDDVFAPPPAIEEVKQASPPPPSFESLIDPPQLKDPPPPSFDTIATVPPPAYQEPTVVAPPVMSAPAYEDLLDHAPQQSLEGVEPMQAPMQAPPQDDDDAMMMMQGLSEEERQALMDEQRKIMEAIEQEKTANEQAIAQARADAFNNRTLAGAPRAREEARLAQAEMDGANPRTVNLGNGQEVALHGQERTRAAIAAGTALLVQCVHCQNWMQVADSATLMFCPVCQVVSPVEKQTAVMTKEEALQMSADRRLAEQLQKEEYAEDEEEEEVDNSWSGYFKSVLGMKKEPVAEERPRPAEIRAPERGEVGFARPPGSSGLVAASSGTETISFDEHEGLLGSGGGGMQRARVAEQKPLFSCVVDSVSNAAAALTTTTLHEDREGNVHGVDASSLLSITQAGRGDTAYSSLDGEEK